MDLYIGLIACAIHIIWVIIYGSYESLFLQSSLSFNNWANSFSKFINWYKLQFDSYHKRYTLIITGTLEEDILVSHAWSEDFFGNESDCRSYHLFSMGQIKEYSCVIWLFLDLILLDHGPFLAVRPNNRLWLSIYIFASVFNSVISIFTNKIKDVFDTDPLRRVIKNHDGDDLSLKDITWCHVGGILFYANGVTGNR